MKKQNILTKLEKEGKLKLVEQSDNVCNSYIEKANNCFKSAKILLENKLYENSISSSYYAMYNSLIALLYKVGIKCENHTGSIFLLKELFEKEDLFDKILKAKEERIDKQYYVNTESDDKSTKQLLDKAEDFVLEIRLIINNINNEDIKKLRDKFDIIFKKENKDV